MPRHRFARTTLLAAVLIAGWATADDPPPTYLQAHLGLTGFFDDDLDATYGAMREGGLGLSWPAGTRTRLALNLAYTGGDGDPYYGVEGFGAPDASRLRLVPLTMVVQLDLGGQDALRLTGGLGVQLAWIRERVPTGEGASGIEEFDAMGAGLVATLGPRWRLSGGRQMISLDFVIGGAGGELHEGRTRHDIDLRGVGLRLGYGMALGSTREDR